MPSNKKPKHTMLIPKNSNNTETERKFLLAHIPTDLGVGIDIIQAYIFFSVWKEMRIRIAGNKGQITIKLGRHEEIRKEFEYIIPKEEGEELIRLATSKNLPLKKHGTLFCK